jgi:hypothetical protein
MKHSLKYSELYLSLTAWIDITRAPIGRAVESELDLTPAICV